MLINTSVDHHLSLLGLHNKGSDLGRHGLGLREGAERDLELALLHQLVGVLAEHAETAAAARSPAVPAGTRVDPAAGASTPSTGHGQ